MNDTTEMANATTPRSARRPGIRLCPYKFGGLPVSSEAYEPVTPGDECPPSGFQVDHESW